MTMRFPPVPANEPPCSEYRARMRERLATRSYFRAGVAWWGIEGMKDPSGAAATIAHAWPAIELLFDASTASLVFGDDKLALEFPSRQRPAADHTEWPSWAVPRARNAIGRTLQLPEAR